MINKFKDEINQLQIFKNILNNLIKKELFKKK